MRSCLALLLVVLGACGGGSDGVTPPNLQLLHDPEIYFHFQYRRDTTGVLPYPAADTAVMRWYQGRTARPEDAVLLAQVRIAVADSVCAYFFVPPGTALYFDFIWRRNGVPTGTLSTIQLDENIADSLAYWDVAMYMDPFTDTYSQLIDGPRARSYCPPGVRRDSIRP